MENKKLENWKKKILNDESVYRSVLSSIDEREVLYDGKRTIEKLIDNPKVKITYHLRNICAELVEAQIDSHIPMPKVTARRPGDEPKAKLIEDFLRSELDRLPFEVMNDMAERTMRIQGGTFYLCEWDNAQRTHTTVGELSVSDLNPIQVIPQAGMSGSIEKMDRITVKMSQTKNYIKRRYGIDVEDEGESDPEIRGKSEPEASDIVTQYIVYYRNNNGGIGIYSFVNDTELEDIEDYQARRLEKCKVCGKTKNANQSICECGSQSFELQNQDYIEVNEPIIRTGDVNPIVVPHIEYDEFVAPYQAPARVPVYKPDIFPVILIKNVSKNRSFLGGSDIDLIRDQQNTINRIEQKIIDKLIKSGSLLSLPDNAAVTQDENEMTVIRLGSFADKEMIEVFNLQADISADMAYMSQVYEEARQTIGITDSFQGRPDRTATSGKAKEFSASQSAGRFASKKTMKQSGFSTLFEVMFKFALAYSDEPKAVLSKNEKGESEYKVFNKWDFLELDSAGEYWWNDQFTFSCEPTTPLASDREAMWQETRMNFSTGTFGNPQDLSTLVLFWSKMEELHYPGAGSLKKHLEEMAQKQEAERTALLQQQAIASQMGALSQE